jgi:hypothetical protein
MTAHLTTCFHHRLYRYYYLVQFDHLGQLAYSVVRGGAINYKKMSLRTNCGNKIVIASVIK